MVKIFFKAIIVVSMIILSVCIFSGCKSKKNDNQEPSKEVYEAPLRNYFDGLINKDIEQISKARPDFMPTFTQLDVDLIYSQYEEKFGANVKLEYTLGDATRVTEQKSMNILTNQIKELYPDQSNINITDAYIISVNLTVSGDGKAEGENSEELKETDSRDFYVYEYEGNWYMF